MATDPTYISKVHMAGPDKMTVESGGEIEFLSGSTLTIADGSIEAGDVALAEGSVFVGNASGVASALDASGDTKMLVGNGTTITSVAMSGDATMANTGAVTIAAGAVDASMLATAVADALPYVTIAAADQTDGTNDVTIQAKDAAGNDLADVVLVKVWYADTEYGAEDAAATSMTATTGTVISSLTANATLLVASDANGTIVLSIDDADGAPVGYIHAEVNGIVASAAVTITGS